MKKSDVQKKKETWFFGVAHPELIKYWHPTRNNGVNPFTANVFSSEIVWWRCGRGHVFKRRLNDYIEDSSCYRCLAKKVSEREMESKSQEELIVQRSETTMPKENPKKPILLIEKRPELIREWHPTKNQGIRLEELTHGTNKKVWWQCEKGHEWEAIVNNRVRGAKCPYCAGKLIAIGETDLATTHPELAKYWDYEFNRVYNVLTPQRVTSKTQQSVWWKCHCGHQFSRTVSSYVNRPICPKCKQLPIL